MTLSNREQISTFGNARQYETFLVGDLRLRIQSLTEGERVEAALLCEQHKKDQRTNPNVWAIILALVDGNGERLYSQADYDLIAGWNSRLTQTIMVELDSLCGVDDRKENDRIEAAAKNLLGANEDGSPSD